MKGWRSVRRSQRGVLPNIRSPRAGRHVVTQAIRDPTNSINKTILTCWNWFRQGDTVCLLFSVICPPEGLGTVDRTTTHRTTFIAALCYQHRCSLIPSEPPWTPTDTGPTIPTASGRDPLSPSTAGPPILEVWPLSMRETEDEAPIILLLLHCPTTLQTGTTGQIINNNSNKNQFHHWNVWVHHRFYL